MEDDETTDDRPREPAKEDAPEEGLQPIARAIAAVLARVRKAAE